MADSISNTRHHAEALVDFLVDHGPSTRAHTINALGWPEGRFGTALKFAREQLLPDLDLTIPAPTPDNGWRYEVTDEWGPVADGAAWVLGIVEARLVAVLRDVQTVQPLLDPRSLDGRAANLLDKRLVPIVRSLEEIYGPRKARTRRGPTPRPER